MRCVFVLFALLLTGCGSTLNYSRLDGPYLARSYPTDVALFERELRVVTFNIKRAQEIDHSLHVLTETPELAGADIILMQEVDDVAMDRIAKFLEYNFVYYPASMHSIGGHRGNGILSRWPIVSHRKLLLPHENPITGGRRIAVFGAIKCEADTVYAYSVHSETPWLSRGNRLEQIASIIDDARALDESDYVVVGGDFNLVRDQSIDMMTGLFAQDWFVRASAGVGHTLRAFFGAFRAQLDHVYLEPRSLRGCVDGTTLLSSSFA